MSKDTSRIHYEILDKKRLEILGKLAPLTANFVLSGGTALSLQINHRKSYDFDFFANRAISVNLLPDLQKIVPIDRVLVNNSDELSVMTTDNIKISFIYYPFLKKSELIEIQNGIKILPISVIASQKAYTIGRRGTYRDYFDIYSILKGECLSLAEIIKVAQEIYGNEIFNPKLFLEQLVYFDDLTNFEIIPVESSKVLPGSDEVKLYLQEEVKKVLKDWE